MGMELTGNRYKGNFWGAGNAFILIEVMISYMVYAFVKLVKTVHLLYLYPNKGD